MLRPPPLAITLALLASSRVLTTSPCAAEDGSLPVLISESRVELPEAAEIGSDSIEVQLHLTIEVDGRVSEATVVESRGSVLDSAALRSATRLTFVPAMKGGRAVRSRIGYVVRFGRGTEKTTQPLVAVDTPPLGKTSEARRTFESPESEVVITGARTPEKKDSSVISTEVITRRDMRLTGATTLDGVLENQPGVQVERTFRGAELWIRGLDPEYTLVLIDGQRIPGRVGGAIDLSRFPLETLERVEVVRGPSSALYGSDAIGGVVNLITRDTNKSVEADAEARVLTADGSAASARVAGRPSKWLGLSLSAGHQYRAPFRRDETSVATTGSENRLDSAGVTVSLGGSRESRLRLSLDYTQNRLDGVDAGAGGAIFDRTQLQEQGFASLAHTYSAGKLHLQSSASYSQFREQYRNDQRGATALDSYQDNREHQGTISQVLAYGWNDGNRTTLGGELLGQLLDSARLESTGHRTRYSAFLEHRYTPLRYEEREILSLVPGARLDVDSQFGTQLSPKLALRYDPLPQLTFRAGYGRGFRAPSFQELLLRFENPAVGYVVSGNPELSAESSHSFDVSAEYRPDRHLFLSAAGFRNDLRDMIATVTVVDPNVAGLLFTYDNIASAWTQGLETQGIWAPHELFKLTAGYTLTETKNEALNRPLDGRPLHRFLLRATSTHEESGVTLSARGTLSLERYFFVDTDDGNVSTMSGSPLAQIDVRISKSLGESLELFTGVNNLAGAGDEYTALLPRQFYAGLRGTY